MNQNWLVFSELPDQQNSDARDKTTFFMEKIATGQNFLFETLMEEMEKVVMEKRSN